MMAAKVFKVHKRVVKSVLPDEEVKTYSLQDFCSMEDHVMENCQFYIINS